MSNKGVSVVVCCYNSASKITKTLEHLLAQNLDKSILWEVILVNNNSTDNTEEVAQELWKKNAVPTRLRIIDEPTPGLSFARIAGVRNAQFSYVLFCDDDNWLQEDYVQIAYNFMRTNPNVGALGGQSIGVLEIDEPIWWEKEKTNYAVGKQAERSGNISGRSYVWGAGIIIRKKILIRLDNAGFISLLSDRKGNVLSSGGDSELCKWSMLMGYKLWYLESLKFVHYITKERLTDGYLNKLLEGHKQAQPILDLYNWFLFKRIFKKVNHLTLKVRGRYLKKALKGYTRNHNRWKQHLQLAFGNSIKIDKELYFITKTYRRLSK